MKLTQLSPFVVESVRSLSTSYRNRDPKNFWTDEEFSTYAERHVRARWGTGQIRGRDWVSAEIRRAATWPLLQTWDRMIIAVSNWHCRSCGFSFDDYYQRLVLHLWEEGDSYDPKRGAYSTWARWLARGLRSKLMAAKAKKWVNTLDEAHDRYLRVWDDEPSETDEVCRKIMKIVDSWNEPRTKEILERRFGLNGRQPESLKLVGTRLGISQERVRQVEERALYRAAADFRRLSTSSAVTVDVPGFCTTRFAAATA